jgi:hypothetical protein
VVASVSNTQGNESDSAPGRDASAVQESRHSPACLRVGASLDDLRMFLLQRGPAGNIWPEPPRHLFTLDRDGEVMAVMATLGHPELRYCFIFRNGSLHRVVNAQGLSELLSVQLDESEWAQSRLMTFAEKVLSETGLDIDRLEERLASDLLAMRRSSPGASHVTGPAPVELKIPPELIEEVSLIKARLDPFRVRCGMRGAEVEALLGPPSGAEPFNDRHALVFAPPNLGVFAPPPILVVLENDMVQAVFTALHSASRGEGSPVGSEAARSGGFAGN